MQICSVQESEYRVVPIYNGYHRNNESLTLILSVEDSYKIIMPY